MASLPESAVVLDLGSGAAPWPRADILVDRYYVDPTGERSGAPIYRDGRPLILAAGERLPFKDKAIDYVFCCHVVEHAEDIEQFIREMSRVGNSGYLECPNLLLERVLNQEEHRWYVANRDGILFIHPKIAKNNITSHFDPIYFQLMSDHYLIRHYWDLFTVQLHWEGEIKYEMCQDIRDLLFEPVGEEALAERIGAQKIAVLKKARRDAIWDQMRLGIRRKYLESEAGHRLLALYRKMRLGRKLGLAAPRVRLQDIEPLLCCPHDRGDLRNETSAMVCIECGRAYPRFDGGINFCPEDNAL